MLTNIWRVKSFESHIKYNRRVFIKVPIVTLQWCFFDLRLNKRLSKQWRRRWFETPSRSLWRHCNTMRPRDVCVHRWIGSLLIWITACLLFAAKPLTGNYLKFTQNADDFLHENVIEFIFWMVIVIFPVNLRSQKSIGSRHLPQGLQNILFKQKIKNWEIFHCIMSYMDVLLLGTYFWDLL